MILLVALLAAIVPDPAYAESSSPDNKWTFSVTPYLWLPNVNGTLKYNIPPGAGGSPDVEVGPNDYLQNLHAVIMLSAEARKERWSVFTDIIYLSFGDEDSSVRTINFGGDLVSSSLNLKTTTSLRGTCWTLGAGYDVLEGKGTTLDVFGGLRYFDLSTSASWELATGVTGPGPGQTFPGSGGVSRAAEFWDGIIGIKGRIPLGSSSWSLPYYVDIGTGTASLTYQAMIGITWSFTDWGNMTLAYRDLYFDQKEDEFVQDLRFSGPALGVTFRF